MLALLDQAFGWLCGQNPDHTWAPGGIPLPFCQRCTGLYVGAAAALAGHLVFRPTPNGRFLQVHGLFLLIMVPLGFHWIGHGPMVRTASGLLFGAGLVAFLFFRFERPWQVLRGQSTAGYFAGLVLTLFFVLYASSRGGIWAGHVLAWIGAAGALILLVLAGGNLVGLASDLVAWGRRTYKAP